MAGAMILGFLLVCILSLALTPVSVWLATRLVTGAWISCGRAIVLALLIIAVDSAVATAAAFVLGVFDADFGWVQQLAPMAIQIPLAGYVLKRMLGVAFGQGAWIAFLAPLFTAAAIAAVYGALYGVYVFL